MTSPSHPIQIGDYRLFWLSRFAASFATTGMVVFLGYQVYDVARADYGMSIPAASFQLGVMGFVQFLPLFLLTPVAGLAADRFDRRIVAGLAIAIDLIVALALALLTLADRASLPLLFVLAALHGTARVFIGPAISSIPPKIVPPELLPRAIALNSMAWQTASVIGPAAFSLAFASTPANAYFASVALLAISAISVLAIRRLPPPESITETHPLRQIGEGFAYVWRERFLLGCVTLDLFAVLLGGATALLPVFARDILHVGLEGLGPMRAAPALGATGVALLLSIRPFAHNVGVKMLWGVVVFGAATIAFGLSRNYWLSLAMLGVIGAGDMVSVFIRNSLVQLSTPDEMRGRVASISGLAISASNELGELQSGLAAAVLGATGAVVFGGVGAIAITALWAVIFPELRQARTFASQYRQKEPAT